MSNYSHVLEGQSDSDDEDKLHIVEEEGSLQDGADCDSVAPDDDPNGTVDRDGRWDDGSPPLCDHIVIRKLCILSLISGSPKLSGSVYIRHVLCSKTAR